MQWRSCQPNELLEELDERAERQEEGGTSRLPPRRPRVSGPPSARKAPGKVSAAARWALRRTEHRQEMMRVATAPTRVVVHEEF